MNNDIKTYFKLHDYQEAMVNFISNTKKVGLFLQMGLGKTRITLASIADLLIPGHVLVIAPNVIARTSWIDEINEIKYPFIWDSFLIDKKTRKNLSKSQRLAKYEECIHNKTPTLYFINRELICDLIDNFNGAWPFKMVIIDEFQSFKSQKSKRFKALKTVINKSEYVVGLTGTPSPNGLMDLWSQIYLLDNGKRLGKNITAYRNMFFDEGKRLPNGTIIEYIPKSNVPCIAVDNQKNILYYQNYGGYETSYPILCKDKTGDIIYSNLTAEEYIYKLISDIVVSMDNCNLQLPDITYSTLKAYMSSDELKQYNQLKKDKALMFGDESIEAVNAAVLTAKLSQLASGNLYINDQHDFIKIHDKKLDVLEYIVNNESDNLLIAYYFQTDKLAILERFPDAVVFDGSPDMVHNWNAGNIRMMLIQPASAGFGLNFQAGGHTLVWYTLTWNLEQYLQTNARLYRQGQKYPVNIIHIITASTVDEKILQALNKKDCSQKALLDAVEFVLNNDAEDDYDEYDI